MIITDSVCHRLTLLRKSDIQCLKIMSSNYSRIKVADLLNDAPARGKTSHRPKPPNEDIFTIICGVCDRKFATVESLNAHQRRSHPAPTTHVCRYCSAYLSSSANLNKHVSHNNPALIWESVTKMSQLTKVLPDSKCA